MRSDSPVWTAPLLALGLGLGCLTLIGGCADESKTTGTQVQLSEKDRAEIEDMRAAMKGQQAARKKEQPGPRGKRP